MSEKLLALKLPPGLHNTGTVYQSKGRWHDGNCVRFTQGTIQPIGGWESRALTGATIAGTVNAAISWQTNDGATYTAIGTTTGLYVIASSTQVYNITPTNISGDGLTHYWQLDVFGAYLVATFNRARSLAAPVNLYYWDGNTSQIARTVQVAYGCPTAVYGLVVTPERFLVALRGADTGAVSGGNFPVHSSRVD